MVYSRATRDSRLEQPIGKRMTDKDFQDLKMFTHFYTSVCCGSNREEKYKLHSGVLCGNLSTIFRT